MYIALRRVSSGAGQLGCGGGRVPTIAFARETDGFDRQASGGRSRARATDENVRRVLLGARATKRTSAADARKSGGGAPLCVRT